MRESISNTAARTIVWALLILGAALSGAALFWVARDVEGGFNDQNVQGVLAFLAQMYLPPLAQVGAYYWAERNDEKTQPSDLGAMLFTLVIIFAYAIVPAAIIFFTPYIEDSAALLGTWMRIAGLTLASSAVAFFFAKTGSSVNQGPPNLHKTRAGGDSD